MNSAKPILATALVCSGILFERMGYYGSRVLLVLFLTRELGFGDVESTTIYGNFTNAIYLFPLLLAPLFDFVIKPKFGAMAGGLISAFGCFALPFVDGPAVYVALGIMVMGVSASRLGNYGTLANSFVPSNNNRDMAFGMSYIAVNIGATISTMVLSWFAMEYGFKMGFIASGVCFVLSSIPMLIGGWWVGEYDEPEKTNDRRHTESEDSEDVLDLALESEPPVRTTSAETKFAWINLPIICLTVVLFWACYETIGSRMFMAVDQFAGVRAQWLNPAFLLIMLPLVMLMLYLLNRGRMKLHYLHMIFTALIVGIAGILIFELNEESFNWPLLISHTFLLTLAEIFISPFLFSYATRISGKKLSCLAIAGVTAMFSLANYFAGFLMVAPKRTVYVLMALLLLLGVGALLVKQLIIKDKGF